MWELIKVLFTPLAIMWDFFVADILTGIVDFIGGIGAAIFGSSEDKDKKRKAE